MTWPLLAAAALAAAVLLWRPGPAARLRQPPEQNGLLGGWHPERRQRAKLSLAVAASCLLLVFGLGWWVLLLAPLAGAASFWILGRLETATQHRSNEQLLTDLPAVCDLLGVCLESGLPLRQATAVVAEVMPGAAGIVLGEISAKVKLGIAESRAWIEGAADVPALATLGPELARAIDSGMAVSLTLRTLGAQARQDAATLAEVRARRVGVRSVLPLMVCFLPAFLLLGVVPIIGGVAQQFLP